MSDFFAALSLPFMRYALIAGVCVALMAGLLGVFVVQRRLSFLGDGLAHAAFGGVALGLFLNLSQPLWVALPFTVAVALGIVWVRDRTELSGDTTIGVFFAVSVALGVLFISLQRDYSVDAWNWLFGSILGVGLGEVALIVAVTLVSLVGVGLSWSQLAYATFDAELAATDGIRTGRLEYFLLALSAVAIVASVRVVGVILMAAYLVIPAATARLVSKSLFQMTLLSLLFGVLSTVIGLVASYLWAVPSGSTIVLTQATLFIIAAVWSALRA